MSKDAQDRRGNPRHHLTAAQLRTVRRLTARHTHQTIAVEVCPVILDDSDRPAELLVLGNGAIVVVKRQRGDGTYTGPRARRSK